MRFFNIFFIFISLFLLSSCAMKRGGNNFIAKNFQEPLFIQMPENTLIFDDVSTLVYTSLWDYFKQLGYRLVDNDKNAFVLQIKVKSLEPVQKFISPDVLNYASKIKLELICSAYDKDQKLLSQKTFCVFSLISNSKDPIMISDFLDYEYRKLAQRAAPKIEHYFRSYWVK